MQKALMKCVIVVMIAGLAACSSITANKSNTPVTPETPAMKTQAALEATKGPAVGEKSMDVVDKSKLSHALDKPLGKSTQWTNGNTGISYTVTPTEKVTINGNSFCRKYKIVANKGKHSQEFDGTACVGADSNWKQQ